MVSVLFFEHKMYFFLSSPAVRGTVVGKYAQISSKNFVDISTGLFLRLGVSLQFLLLGLHLFGRSGAEADA
jgi:hypothetical protein